MLLGSNRSVRTFLHGIAIDIGIGIHPWERFPQHLSRITVDLEIWLEPTQRAPDDDRANEIVDYDLIRKFINEIPSEGHVDYLETLADKIASKCFEIYGNRNYRVKISKPFIFNEVNEAGIDVTYRASSSNKNEVAL